MLNFGYWTDSHDTPIAAQENMCRHFGALAELDSARNVLDVGSGLSAPAKYWKRHFEHLSLFCVDINCSQLLSGRSPQINSVNSSSALLPFANGSADRILALESSQHFKPFLSFLSESRRVLSDSGLLALAVPVTVGSQPASRLGILKFTWSSEHYSTEQIRDFLSRAGFSVSEERHIGSSVYVPLADYYLENRDRLKRQILRKYPPIVERVLFRSLQRMKRASESRVIDYILLKCRL